MAQEKLDFTQELCEKLLFAKILKDKNFTTMLASEFDKRWFSSDKLSKVTKLCLNFYKKNNIVPNMRVLKALIGKFCEVTPGNDPKELIEVATDALSVDDFGAEYDEIISSNLINFVRRRALWTSMMDNADEIETNPDGVIDNCLTRFDKINKLVFSGKDLGMNFFDESDMEKHWTFIRNPDDKIPSGWDALDIYMNGGFWREGKMLGAFMGQAGLGKSLFLSNLAVNCLKSDYSVVVVSLEMSQDVYAMRFDAHLSGDDINRLKENEVHALQTIKKFHSEHPKTNLFIKEYPPRAIRCRDIEMYLDNLKLAGHNFDVVIIDYLNLVLPNHSTDSMYKDIQAVSEQLRALSYKYSCPFWTATQANTDGINNENIDLQNVSESRGITHTLDFLAGLFQTPDDREAGIIKMRLLKNRLGGKVGKVCSFKVDSSNLLVKDITFDPVVDSGATSKEADEIASNMNDIAFEIE